MKRYICIIPRLFVKNSSTAVGCGSAALCMHYRNTAFFCNNEYHSKLLQGNGEFLGVLRLLFV